MIILQIASNGSTPSASFTIIISIIGSGALSAVISFFVNQRMKIIDYKFDYRKHILQKRQNAYNEIEKLLIRLGDKRKILKIDKPIHTIFTETTSSENPVHDFLDYLTKKLNENIFWISRDIHDKLVTLLQFLSTYHTIKNNQNIITRSQLEEIGVNNFEKIELLRIDICTQFFLDIKELENIEKFKSIKRHF